MKQLRRTLQADILKGSRSSFFLLHLIIPAMGISVFLGYQLLTKYPANRLTINFFQVLTLIYPIIAAWLTTIISDQEIEAGSGFFLLNAPSKPIALTAKILLLILPGLFSCLFVGIGYHLILSQFFSDYSLPASLIFLLVGVVWCCSLFQYLFHLWLGLCFGRNVNFSIATVELLLCALLLTGLGETIWFFFPCSWGIRLVPLITRYFTTNSTTALMSVQFGGAALILLSLLMLLFLFLWFYQWEGRKNDV